MNLVPILSNSYTAGTRVCCCEILTHLKLSIDMVFLVGVTRVLPELSASTGILYLSTKS